MTTWAMPETISPSRLGTFFQCPLRFRVESIQKFRGGSTDKMLLGTTVHAALEYLIQGEDRSVERLMELADLATMATCWNREFGTLQFSKQAIAGFHTRVRNMCMKWLEMEDPAAIGHPGDGMTRTEQIIKVDIGGWVLSGIIDRMDPGPRIVDYKTGRVPMEQYQAKALLGMDCYALMCLEEVGEIPLSLELVYIAENQRIRREPNARQVEATRRKIMAVHKAVERCCEQDNFRPSPSKLCDWCHVKPYCPAHGGDPGLVPVAVDMGRVDIERT